MADVWTIVHCKLKYPFEDVSHGSFRGKNVLVNYLLIERVIFTRTMSVL